MASFCRNNGPLVTALVRTAPFRSHWVTAADGGTGKVWREKSEILVGTR